MKKDLLKAILLFILMGFNSRVDAQMVYIADPNFLTFLNNNFPACMSGSYIDQSCPSVQNTTYLDVSSLSIATLEGISAFTNLTDLTCDNNQIGSLPILPSGLQALSCNNNNIFNIGSNLPTGLTYLSCQQNGIPNIGANLPSTLTYFDCSANSIHTIVSLPTSLTTFYCSENILSNLPSLPQNLDLLDCSLNTQLTLQAVPPNLTELYCDSLFLLQLSALPTNLKIFSCSNNKLSNLPTLNSVLERLTFNNNNISSLTTLPATLQTMDCSNNPLHVLPPLPNLIDLLNCSFDSLSFLPTLPVNLGQLDCSGNQLTSLPSLPSNIYKLTCEANQLSSLPSLPATLSTLDISYNLFTALPVLQVTYLDCSWNQITDFPTFTNSKVGAIYINNNNLTNIVSFPDTVSSVLNISNNPSLSCLPRINKIYQFIYNNTNIQCMPNYGSIYAISPYPLPPLCTIMNSNGCEIDWNIAGQLYYDADTNCLFSNGDNALYNQKIKLYSNGILNQQVYTNGDGQYSFDTDSLGIYTIETDTSNIPFTVLCPITTYYSDTLTIADSLKQNRDFAMKCKGTDVGVWSINSYGVRPGYISEMRINAGDYSNMFGGRCAASTGGLVTIIINGSANYYSPSTGALTPNYISGDTLKYMISDFGLIDYKKDFNFKIKTDTSAVIGSQICISVVVSSSTFDYNSGNDSLKQCYTVSGSYDPNEKQVYPQSFLDINGDRWLTYTIQFQNTGTAEADNITILDTLDSNLDLSTFELVSFSHQPVVRIYNSQLAKFNFQNIHLPDSSTDEPGSHGFVQYKIQAKNNVVLNTTIDNTAYIYFDFNAPVKTNVVSNTVFNCSVMPNMVSQVQTSLSTNQSLANYQWLDCASGTAIPGAINQSFTPLQSGQYAVIVNYGQCVDTSSCVYFSTVGLEKINNTTIVIQPNPFKEEFQIKSDKIIDGIVEIYNAIGASISNQKIQNTTLKIDCKGWQQGVYYLKIISKEGTIVKKLVKE